MTTEDTATGSTADATAVLHADHERIKDLFREFVRLDPVAPDEELMAVVKLIFTELAIHDALEEEVFYPTVRRLIGDDSLMNKADVEHGTMRYLLDQLRSADDQAPYLRAKISVLREYTQHHINQEENDMFPKLKKAGVDLEVLGKMLMDRKQSLRDQWNMQPIPSASPDSSGTAPTRH